MCIPTENREAHQNEEQLNHRNEAERFSEDQEEFMIARILEEPGGIEILRAEGLIEDEEEEYYERILDELAYEMEEGDENITSTQQPSISDADIEFLLNNIPTMI